MAKWCPFARTTVVIDFTHIVCKPGDVVCIALPVGLSSKALEYVREAAARFEEDTGVKLRAFADGIQISGEVQ